VTKIKHDFHRGNRCRDGAGGPANNGGEGNHGGARFWEAGVGKEKEGGGEKTRVKKSYPIEELARERGARWRIAGGNSKIYMGEIEIIRSEPISHTEHGEELPLLRNV